MRWGPLLVILCSCDLAVGIDEVPDHATRVLVVDPQASETLTDFPVSVVLSDVPAKDASQIAFTDRDGRPLPYEIVAFDGTSLEAWVTMTLAGPTELHLDYGVPAAPHDPSATWAGYAGAWHLTDPADVRDSSPMHHDARSVGDIMPVLASGQIGSGFTFEQIAGDERQCVDGPVVDGTTSFTLEAWVNIAGPVGADTFDTPVCAGGTGTPGVPGFAFEDTTGVLRFDLADPSTNVNTDYSARPTGRWISLAAVVDRAAARVHLYIDGVPDMDGDITVLGDVANANDPFCLSGQHGYNGDLDEVRLATRALSPEWIRAEYNNVFRRSDFVHTR